MSTTRSQKRKNNQQEISESVSEGFVPPIIVGNSCPLDQYVSVAGPFKPRISRIEGSFLESLRASLKDEITSEIKNLLVESQKEMLRLLKPETKENVRETLKRKRKMKLGVSLPLRNQSESIRPKITTCVVVVTPEPKNWRMKSFFTPQVNYFF